MAIKTLYPVICFDCLYLLDVFFDLSLVVEFTLVVDLKCDIEQGEPQLDIGRILFRESCVQTASLLKILSALQLNCQSSQQFLASGLENFSASLARATKSSTTSGPFLEAKTLARSSRNSTESPSSFCTWPIRSSAGNLPLESQKTGLSDPDLGLLFGKLRSCLFELGISRCLLTLREH